MANLRAIGRRSPDGKWLEKLRHNQFVTLIDTPLSISWAKKLRKRGQGEGQLPRKPKGTCLCSKLPVICIYYRRRCTQVEPSAIIAIGCAIELFRCVEKHASVIQDLLRNLAPFYSLEHLGRRFITSSTNLLKAYCYRTYESNALIDWNIPGP